MATALETRDETLAWLLADEIDEAVRITLAYTVELDAVAAQVGAVVRQAFEALEHTDRDDIATFITEAEPWVRAGIDEGSDLAAAYMSEMTGTTLTPAEIVLPDVPYSDPFLRTWHQLAEGDQYGAARESGSTVAELMGYDATSDGAAARMGTQPQLARAWARVTSAKACEWCRVVSTQLYKSQRSATFGHHGCKCAVVAVFDTDAKAVRAINSARLRELKASGAVKKVSEARIKSRERERFAKALL